MFKNGFGFGISQDSGSRRQNPNSVGLRKKWRREECLLTPVTKGTKEGTCGLIHGCMVDPGCSKITWGFFLLPSFQIASFSCMFSLCCGKDDPEDLLYLLRNPNRKGVYLSHHSQKKDQDYFSSVHWLWTHSWDNHYDFVWAWVTQPPLALRSGLRPIQTWNERRAACISKEKLEVVLIH